RPVACANPLFGDHKVKDVPAFCVASKAVKFAGLGVDRERRRLVFMERTPQAQLQAVLARFLHSPLHQRVMCEHVSDAHLAFYFLETDPLLCHTWYPFRYVCARTSSLPPP